MKFFLRAQFKCYHLTGELLDTLKHEGRNTRNSTNTRRGHPSGSVQNTETSRITKMFRQWVSNVNIPMIKITVFRVNKLEVAKSLNNPGLQKSRSRKIKLKCVRSFGLRTSYNTDTPDFLPDKIQTASINNYDIRISTDLSILLGMYIFHPR